MSAGQTIEPIVPAGRRPTPWASSRLDTSASIGTCHEWTDGPYRKSADLGWVVMRDDIGAGPDICQAERTLGAKQTANDPDKEAIKAALIWDQTSTLRHMAIHSVSTGTMSRTYHSGAGPGQRRGMETQNIIARMFLKEGQTAQILWVKGHGGTTGNETADGLAEITAEKTSWLAMTSLAHLRLGISEKYRTSKDSLH
jgi:ribonuclease HI